ncbi:hypothetical protein HRbin17_01653 [bacterium HR17]|jgi:predicted RNA-binding Zn-ribbon protein involved in translation (DUF1610 family)|uniref:DZANK-type domain-containing protein n=1 Tax=Candidatus Fervidibacter japonicus TaxID=2035412 RepID=A0A2H5XD76_9BACT|nr:hypothetical protein HRbin17_01653 [bacterium HR17]
MERDVRCPRCKVAFVSEDDWSLNFCPLCGLDLRQQTCQMCGATLPSWLRAHTANGEEFMRVRFCFVCGAALPVPDLQLTDTLSQ